jgi:hypothetical protein
MKRGIWLISGIAIGLVAARRLSENPKAQAVVDDAARRAKEFGNAVAEGFKEREAEISAAPKKPAATRKPAARKPVAKRPAAKKPVAKKS